MKNTWNKTASAQDMNSREIVQRNPAVASGPPGGAGPKKKWPIPMPKPKARKVNKRND